jgi:hypothetical protein
LYVGQDFLPRSRSTSSFSLNGEAAEPSGASIAPVVSQVQNPTINSSNLFNATTVDTTSMILSWSPPAIGTAYGYSVIPPQVIPIPNGVEFVSAEIFYSPTTSVTLPPLAPGNTYLFEITALADASADIQTKPYRSSSPTGFATIVAAPITISSSASSPRIHDPAGIVKQLLRPRVTFLSR